MNNIPRSDNNLIVNGIVQNTQNGIIPTGSHVTSVQQYPNQYMASNYMYNYAMYQTPNIAGCSGVYIPQYQSNLVGNYPAGSQPNYYGGTINGYNSTLMTTNYGPTQPNTVHYPTQELTNSPANVAQKIYLNQSTIISKPILNISYQNSVSSHEQNPLSSFGISANLSSGTTNAKLTDSNLKSVNEEKSLDIENFKKEFFNFHDRKYGWEVLLQKEERDRVEKMLQETIDFELHYYNFENNFNKMKTQTASSNYEEILTRWTSWKSKLLERRNECRLQIQEKLDKLYKKICQDFPLFATTGKLPTDITNVDRKNDDETQTQQQQQQMQKSIKTKQTESNENSNLTKPSIITNQLKQQEDKIETQLSEQSLSTVSSNNNIEKEILPADKSNNTEVTSSSSNETMISSIHADIRIEKALENQEGIRNKILRYMDPALTKHWNDLQFLRNEMMFIDKSLTKTRRYLNPIMSDKKKSPSPINQSKGLIKKPPLLDSLPNLKPLLPLPHSYSSPLLPAPKMQPVEEAQPIKIQVTNHGRKVKDMSLDTILDSAKIETKDQPRSNNIEVPISKDIEPKNSNSKTKTENHRSSQKVIVDIAKPKIDTSSNSSSRKRSSRSSDSTYFESTYYDSEYSENKVFNHDPYCDAVPDNDRSMTNDINLFIERERRSLAESQQKKQSYTDPNFFTLPRKYNEEPLYIKDLLDFPARSYRPSKIVFIVRGIPGSGKSYLSKLIKEREEKNNSLAKTRLLSLDDYFLVERDNELDTRGSRSMPTLVYEYDPIKEDEYKHYLFKEYRKITMNGYYNFIILDSVNSTINEVRNYYICAIENQYTPYVIEMEAIVRRLLNDCINSEEIIAHCYKHNRHGRSLSEIRILFDKWEILPFDFLRVDAGSLVVNYCSNNTTNNNQRNSLSTQSYPDKNSLSYLPVIFFINLSLNRFFN